MNSDLTFDLPLPLRFWRFGLLEEKRPVTVFTWFRLWWMMPSSLTSVSIPFFSPVFGSVVMKYVLRSLDAAACSPSVTRNGMFLLARASITSLEVEYTPGFLVSHFFSGWV